jgi:hypothetical protein
MGIKIDPKLQRLIPPLTSEEYAQLEANLLVDGCRDPLVVWKQNGDTILLDGHNRLKICEEHSLTYDTVELELADMDAAKNWMDANQLGRRNLTRELMSLLRGRRYDREKKIVPNPDGIGGKSHKIVKGQNDLQQTTAQKIAAEHGVSEATIKRDGKFAEECEKDPELEKVVMARGDVKKYKKDKQKKEQKQKRKEIAETVKALPKNDRYKIFQADIKTVKLDRQYDFIITDPPYPKEYLPLYETLAIRAKEWLSPNGLLIAMAGQSYLDQIYSMMQKHLEYYWTACYFTPGQPKPLRQVNVNCSWKPLLIFQRKGDKYKGKIFGDVFRSEQNEKQHHEWGQSESGMFDIVSKICLPGQSILDPFLGGGTTGVVAVRHGCYFEGFDILEENAKIAAARMDQ